MKRKLLLVGLITLTLGLEACSGETASPQETTVQITETQPASTEQETTEPETTVEETIAEPESAEESQAEVSDPSNILLMTEVKTAPVMNGSKTETIGTRAYIDVSKEDLKNITDEQYMAFVDTVVKDSGYNWFTISCDDGTGIFFSGSIGIVSTYGQLDEEGCITETIGNIMISEGVCTYEPAN